MNNVLKVAYYALVASILFTTPVLSWERSPATLLTVISSGSSAVSSVSSLDASDGTPSDVVSVDAAGAITVDQDLTVDGGDLIVAAGDHFSVGGAAQGNIGQAVTWPIQMHSDGTDAGLALVRWTADANPVYMIVGKTRSATVGTPGTIVHDNDLIFSLSGVADDGTDLDEEIATINMEVDDSTPAANAVGGALHFATSNPSGTVTSAMYISSAQEIGVGTTAPDGTMHIFTASAGAVTASPTADELVLENNTSGGMTFLTPDADASWIVFGSASNSTYTRIKAAYSGGTPYLDIGQDATTLVCINDTSNAYMDVGLTIQQGGGDQNILALKSSDVNSGLTTGTQWLSVETDDYYTIGKRSSAVGGAVLTAVAEDVSLNSVYNMEAYGGTGSTTKTTSAVGLFQMTAYEHDGANGITNIAADGNVLVVSARVSGSTVARFLVDEDGDVYSVTTPTTFDDADDIEALSAYEYVRSDGNVIETDFEDFARYNEDDLIAMGILGGPVDDGGMTNMTQLMRFHNGAIRANARALRANAQQDSIQTDELASHEVKLFDTARSVGRLEASLDSLRVANEDLRMQLAKMQVTQ